MRSIKRLRVVANLAVTVALVALISGCTPADPQTKQVSESAPAAPFANDEEALAAAKATYEDFMAVANTIMVEGGASPDRLDTVATREVAEPEKEGFKELASRELTFSGASTIRAAVLQTYAPRAKDGRSIVRAYFCVDVSAVEVRDETGASVVNPARPIATPFEVAFDLVENDPPRLLVSAKNLWGGDGVC